jgi:hypothetical protein
MLFRLVDGDIINRPQEVSRYAMPLLILIVNSRQRDVGGYPKNSDNYPNTSGVLNAFKYKIRAQRD